MLEAARNVACVGAVPKALVNCLNFGNPEHPEVMWQFAEVVDGMSDACRALGIPVVGGNVSFYNESHGRDIDPTPVVGVVGLIDAAHLRAAAGRARTPVTRIVVLGDTAPELGGSEWARLHGLRGGTPPAADLDAAGALHDFVRALVDRPRGARRARLLRRRARGRARRDGDRRRRAAFEVALRSELVPALAWFSESASRVVVAVDPDGGRTPSSSAARRRQRRLPSASAPPAVTGSWPTAPSTSPSPTPPTPGATRSRPPSADPTPGLT